MLKVLNHIRLIKESTRFSKLVFDCNTFLYLSNYSRSKIDLDFLLLVSALVEAEEEKQI